MSATVPEPARAARVVPLPSLRVLTGPAAGTSIRLEHEDGTLGRRSDNAYVVADPTVSRVHARVTRDEDGSLRVTDLGSAAGIVLNGEPCGRTRTVAHGDRLVLGSCELVVEHPVGRSTEPGDTTTMAMAVPAEEVPAVELSPRQAQVLALIAEGMTNIEIGEELGITERTVKAYAQELYTRLGVRNRAGAVAEGVNLGLL